MPDARLSNFNAFFVSKFAECEADFASIIIFFSEMVSKTKKLLGERNMLLQKMKDMKMAFPSVRICEQVSLF